MITAQSISLNIQKYCKREGISQRELAKRLGVSQQTVNRWVLYERRPSLTSIELLQNTVGSLDEEENK